jgi:hypothetical protein
MLDGRPMKVIRTSFCSLFDGVEESGIEWLHIAARLNCCC